MKSLLLIPVFFSVALAIGAAGCSMAETRMASTGNNFPTGRFASAQDSSVVAVINPDGSYTGTNIDGKDWVKGKYVIAGNKVSFADNWMADADKENSCVGGGDGTYRWDAIGTDIRFTLIDDPCSARAKGLSGTTWTRLR